ncbi:LytR/AlgR family response regulator transcription factor [Sulfobacillus harzensis]|uniref:Stage 0 sporulation protein A homolog n=1 Tax=Sulfobacillus harzensis TaxID=2729629 RepID=A0A7Y0L589_9FIRM|nr:LytTR family DNA-binding domain-containing protein [Sulfobacillus harzensis]NMP22119.1 response regulator transcription factor [Sulfobacillus harzensis]
MLPLKALIVEDEAPARMELRYLLEPHKGVVQVVGEAASAEEARTLIAAIDYDVIFLDVSMPGESGMALGAALKSSAKRGVKLVFISAYEEYALDAFSVEAVDYLLKPVSPERISETIRRLTAGMTPVEGPEEETAELLEWVPCDQNGHTAPVPIEEICYIQAELDTIYVATRDGRKPTRFTLGELENRLPSTFIRTHRSFIVHTRYVKEIMPHFNGTYLLKIKDKRESEVPVSRANVRRVKEVFHLA